MSDVDKLALGNFHVENTVRSIEIARQFVSKLYDAGSKMVKHQGSLNDLRLKMCTSRTVSISHVPPCEAAFLQHVRRASWQWQTWTTSHLQLPTKRKLNYLVPIEHKPDVNVAQCH